MTFDIRKTLAKLSELRERDRSLEIFGAADHRYVVNEPLEESAVARFERRHGIQLPEDYRRFLLEVGNGGAGPAYGVFKLGEMDDGWKTRRWKKGDGLIGELSAPFPHVRRWNKLPRMPKVDEDHPDFETLMEHRDREYMSTENVNGAIPISNLGCGLRHWLVVNGREAGHIWVDERADEAGLFPLSRMTRRRFTFGEWYNKWLGDSLREVKTKRRGR